ncbi:MAG: VOC family protein [Actinomycetota bacterium]
MNGIVQVAYGVADPETAAAEWQQRGAGPFVVNRHIELAEVLHDGADATLDHSSAYGAWGNVMVELICVHDATPPSLLDGTRSDGTGVHHVAVFAEDLDRAAEEQRMAGRPEVVRAATANGVRFAWFDASATLGHLVEVYERHPLLEGFYARLGITIPGEPTTPATD